MKIGLVLSKPPTYSETFFMSKIKGLQVSGHEVILFVQGSQIVFNLCQVVKAPKVYKRNVLLQFYNSLAVVFKLFFFSKQLITFIQLERQVERSWKQIFKNLYNNSHILTAKLDWLHFGFATMALQSEHVAKSINAKMAVSLRGFDISIYPISHPNCYSLLWDNVDKVHAISKDLLKLAYANGMKKETLFQIITPAINSELFKNNKSRFEKSSTQINFLTVARLHWKKGLTDTLEALALLKQRGFSFKYTIVGTGILFEQLMFAIHQLQLQEEVKLVGEIPHDEIVNYLEIADIYLQYSLSEGFCNAVLEAQAMGLLCIVSDAEGLQENVLDGKTGIIVAKRQPKVLAKAIENLLHLSIKEKEDMRKAAQERVKQNFNLEKQGLEFLSFYE